MSILAHLHRGFLLALLMLLLLPAAAHAADALTLEADNLEFSPDGQSVTASGHVILVYQDITIKAETLSRQGAVVQAAGGVELTAKSGSISADRLAYNLETRALTADQVRGQWDGLFLQADHIEPGETQGSQILTGAGITRCDLAVPCYALRAGKISIDGDKVTIERGWLLLKGVPVLPLPKLTLDLANLDAWPRLNLGYDTDGLYLSAQFTNPLSEQLDLVVGGKLATVNPLSLDASLDWQASKALRLSPWYHYDTASASKAGLDADLSLGKLGLSFTSWYAWPDPAWRYGFQADLPLGGLFTGQLALEAYYHAEQPAAAPTGSEYGLALTWTKGQRGGDEYTRLGVSYGSAETGGAASDLAGLHYEGYHRLNEDWGLGVTLTYDPLAAAWRTGSAQIKRYLHCFYVELNYDWLDGDVAVTGGISF